MGSAFATKFQRNRQASRPAIQEPEAMPLTSEQHAATEVLAMADKWVDQRETTGYAPPDQKAREVGRLRVRGDELAKAVKKYRKAGKP